MADRLKDEEDKRLESLFRFESVRDDGFSVQVVSRVRRRLWVRRLALPFAFVIGAAIAAKPLLQLADALPDLFSSIGGAAFSLDKLPIGGLPQASTLIMSVVLLATVMMIGRMLEE